jgi:ketosteroid isomerase-like protein
MKYCPQCQSQFTDETLRFCLQDGAVLTGGVQQSSIDTVAFTNQATFDKFAHTEQMRVNFPDRIEHPRIQAQPVKLKSQKKLWLAALPVLIVLGAAGAGGWFYFNSQNMAAVTKSDHNPPVANLADPTVATEVTSTKSHQNQPTGSDKREVKNEITEFVNLWKESFESRNLAEYTAKYAEKVDYLDKTGTNPAEIHRQTQKIFSDYSEIEITLSNLRVAVDGDDDRATAVFDKEWSYETDQELTTGKNHTKLSLEKTGNEWKIVSEKTLKTYYTEN